nr:acyl-CoA dehydrogenase family protein [Candidatus Sigynarchaeota archaeon]
MKSIFSNLTDDQKKWKEQVDAVLKVELEPHVEAIESGKKDVIDVIKALGKHGYCGITFPEKYGGLGLTVMHELILTEAICSYSLPVDMSRLSGSYPAMLAKFFGKMRDLKDYIEPLVKGEKIGAFCFTEPDAGSDLSRMKTIAEKDPATGELILTGEKRFITNGSVADVLVVYARNGAFIIDSKWKGFEVVEEYKMMGLHGLHLGHIKFNAIRVPAKNALFFTEIKPASAGQGKTGKTDAISAMQDMLSPERIMLSVQALGVAKTALKIASDYSQSREQFKQPISAFEGISFKIADMATKFEAAKALVEKSVNAMQNGTLAAMAKLFSCQVAFEICDDAVQILGGIGYTNKYPVERCLRDVRLLRIGGGTDEIMKYIIQKGIYKGEMEKELKPGDAKPSMFG